MKFDLKNKKLKKQTHIDLLFQSGEAFKAHPFVLVTKLIDRNENDNVPVKIGVSASKKKLNNASDRNRMKRIMREVVRLNQELILEVVPNDKTMLLMLIYAKNELLDYKSSEEKILLLLQRLKEQDGKID